jgi:plastocyanin
MQQPRAGEVALVAALLVFTLVGTACSGDEAGGDGGATTETGSGDVVPGTAAIGIADLAFEPTTVPVAAGSTDITVTNADSTDHTFTLDDGSVDVQIAAGQETTVTVDLSESIGFHCEIHPSMTGTLQVA